MPAVSLYPKAGLGAPKDRTQTRAEVGLPTGTEVFSADNHISLAEDIWYERFPANLKEQAPRVMYEDGAWVIGVNGHNILPPQFSEVLMQYDPMPSSATNNIDARLAALESEGVSKELAFPNAILALFGFPDKRIRELCFRIYNEYIAEVQQRSGGRIYGVGLINWWDAAGCRTTLEELKALGLKTFLMPLLPSKHDDGTPIDYGSLAMDEIWAVIEEVGVPVAHHIGETPTPTPNEFNSYCVGMLSQVASFREVFGKYIFGGILDRHPKLKIGWFEGGINWVPAAIQDAEHMQASFRHLSNLDLSRAPAEYWNDNMYSSFMVDALGLQLADRIGTNKIMWSSDFPHNESTYGYTEKSLARVVDAVGPETAVKIVDTNVRTFLGV
jgi:predicted TIM-barrel fold metal-dependent hydrolase